MEQLSIWPYALMVAGSWLVIMAMLADEFSQQAKLHIDYTKVTKLGVKDKAEHGIGGGNGKRRQWRDKV